MVNEKLQFRPKFKVNAWCFDKCLDEEKAQNPEGKHLGILKIVYNSTVQCPDCNAMLYKKEW